MRRAGTNSGYHVYCSANTYGQLIFDLEAEDMDIVRRIDGRTCLFVVIWQLRITSNGCMVNE
jgi:hypothetical protein